MANNRTEDLSFDYKDINAPAIFLPSLGPNYIRYASLYEQKMLERPGRNPEKMSHDGRELNFLRPDSENFYWPYALYSAGHADLRTVDNEAVREKETMICNRDPNTIIVGDSGGYQIGKGIMNFDWLNFDSQKNDDLRMKILRWLEATADISMTLDVPVWGIDEERCGLKDFDDCLQKTMYNHEFFIKNRVPGATRFLNVLHGRNKEETDKWWDTVKDLPFDGWAFAGVNMSDFERILRRLVIMRDEGYLDEKRNWIHFLGVSRITSACAFSAIQRTLRKHVDPAITISYDASSPFYSTAKGRIYTRHTYTPKNLNYSMDGCFDNKDLCNSEIPFPFLSPIGKKLKVGDICYKGYDEDTKSSWDTFSYMYLMNHNCYMHIKGIVEANNLFRLPRKNAQEWIPSALLDFNELVEKVFTSDRPFDLIDQNHKMLNNLSGLKMENKKLNVVETTGLFKLEDTEADQVTGEVQEHDFDDSILGD